MPLFCHFYEETSSSYVYNWGSVALQQWCGVTYSFFFCYNFRREGVRGFYKGLLPNLIRVTPATALTFVVYENVSHALKSKSRDEKNNSTHDKDPVKQNASTSLTPKTWKNKIKQSFVSFPVRVKSNTIVFVFFNNKIKILTEIEDRLCGKLLSSLKSELTS